MKKSPHKFITSIVIVLLLSLGINCHDTGTNPPVDMSKIKLTLMDVAVREVYLNIHLASPLSKQTVAIQRNGITLLSFVAVTDTTIADTGLVSNTGYIYQALRQVGGTTDVKSNEVQINTLTPTSHSFTWQTFVLGGGDDSWLRDVTAINQDNIWAVGWISVRDSSGQVDPNPYNAIHWNGQDSPMIRIPTKIWNTTSYITGELKAIFSISSSYIIVSTGGQVIWYNGREWGGDEFLFTDINDTTFGSLTRFAGFNQFRIWGVGDKGNIFFYGGNNWQRIVIDLTTPINDICGIVNTINQKEEVYCAVSDIFKFNDRKILKIVDDKIDTIAWDANKDVVLSVWTNRGFPFYVGGGLGLYENKTGTWKKIDLGIPIYPSCIRGTGLNNIFVVGSFGIVAHYNGIDWKIIPDVYNAAYNTVAVKGNVVAVVGSQNGKAILTIGKKL